jgi:peptide/nickel transport system ATP-binding protein
MQAPDLLEVRGLTTHFHTPEGTVRAVENVSLRIRRGRTLGVLGESGSGKSVTALSILQLIPRPPGRILAGEVRFQGQDLLRLAPSEMFALRGKHISMIFQEPMTSLNPVYPVGDQIAEIFQVHEAMRRGEAWEQATRMLRTVGIPAPERRVFDYPHQFSGGMRQRVMIAMAIACRPQLLIADEPTTALDVTIQAQILDLMLALQEELGMAMLMITHDLGVIAEMSDDVAVMYAGEVVETLPRDALFSEPQHPYTRGLLRSVPKLGEKFRIGKRPLQELPGVVPSLNHLPQGCPFAPRCSEVHDRCREARPPLFILNEEHTSKCWLAEGASRGVVAAAGHAASPP